MKKLYVIGNGFELHRKLPTNYYDYIMFLRKREPEFVKRFNAFLERYVETNRRDISINNIHKWFDLESYTRFIYKYDLNEILEEAIASAEDDLERANYWSDIQYECYVDEILENIRVLKKIEVYDRVQNACEQFEEMFLLRIDEHVKVQYIEW